MRGKVTKNEHGFEVFENPDVNYTETIDESMLDGLEYVDVKNRKYMVVKRIVDIIGAFVALIILFVPFILLSIIIFVDNPGPVFFRQYRVGLNGKRFRLYKFRSMKTHAPKYKSTFDMTDSGAYITRVGRILRKTSIDELPQFFNVLRGDMSLVGPRPLISDEYEIHKLRMRFGVYNVRPGITGLAQINGRDTVTIADKVRYDAEYIRTIGLFSDLRILFATVPRVFGARGVVEGKSQSIGM